MAVFDWTRFLVLAEELASRGQDEAALRSAVSRAYYAAFGKTRQLLRSEGVALPANSHAHLLVWRSCRLAEEPGRRYVGMVGDRLRKKRNAADYNDSLPDLPRMARDSIQIAQRLLSVLERK